MSENLETGWWSELNSNYRYRFLNCQTTAPCYNFRRSGIPYKQMRFKPDSNSAFAIRSVDTGERKRTEAAFPGNAFQPPAEAPSSSQR